VGGLIAGSLTMLAAVAQARPQAGLIRGPEVLVVEEQGADIVEAHLAVSPVDPLHLVGAAMVVRSPDLESIDCIIVTSFDGGATWIRHELGWASCGDPWTLVTEAGTPVVAVLGDDGMSIYRSSDGGRTWPERPTRIDGAHDHEMMVGGRDGEPLYVVSGRARRTDDGAQRSAVFVARSTDDGRSFDVIAERVLSNLSYEATTPVIAASGSLLVPFQDHHRSGGNRVASRRSWLLAFDAGGETGPPRLIDEGCNRIGPVGWPTLAHVRLGGGERLVWACERENAEGIALRLSDDLGETWRDGPVLHAPDRPTWTKVPGLAASAAGALMATWTQGSEGGEGCRSLLGAASLDGGNTFGPPLEIGDARSCPGDSGVRARFPAGGDYTGIVAVGDHEFHLLWADARSGRFSLWARRVRIGG